MSSSLPSAEPDQIAERWDDHVTGYETVFEPFSLTLTRPVLTRLTVRPGARVLDVAAGPGGAAIELARMGARVVAVDAAPAMVARAVARADAAGLPVECHVMDAERLAFADATFDAALSSFGIVLVPDAAAALAEMRRTVKPGGRIAVVTWTEPHRYELATLLGASADAVWPGRPRTGLPAQLRFREPAALCSLFEAAGLPQPEIERVEAHIEAPSAEWLVANLSFAPGMDSMLSSLGDRRKEVCDTLYAGLRSRFGNGAVRLAGVAHIGFAVASENSTAASAMRMT